MKRSILSLLLCGLLLAGGCTAPTAPVPPPQATTPPPQATTPPPQATAPVQSPGAATLPAAFVYDIYHVDAYTQAVVQPNMAYYRALFDGVDAFAERVPISGQAPTQEETARLAAAVLARFEFSYLYGVSLAPDGTAFLLHYAPGYTHETAMAAKNAFREKVTYLLTQVASPAYSDMENALAVYRYFGKTTYREDAPDVGCYGVMVSGEGICTGYAYAMRYLLDQLSIPSHLAFSSDESHVWNLVELDGAWYHLDATWEGMRGDDVPRLNFFGMTDAQRKLDFDSWYGGGNSNYPHYDLPAAQDDRFAFLRDSQQAEADLEGHRIQYTTLEGTSGCYAWTPASTPGP